MNPFGRSCSIAKSWHNRPEEIVSKRRFKTGIASFQLPVRRLQDSWTKENVTVSVLHSVAGLATQILVSQVNSDGSERDHLLIDVGDGTTRDLVESKTNIHLIQGILLSHGHYDHCSGLHGLLGFFRMLGRENELQIVYPQGSIEIEGILNNFEQNYKETIPYRIIRKPITTGKIGTTADIGDWTIRCVNVIHYGSTLKYGVGDRIPALAFQLTNRAVTLGYSGDTGPTPSLLEVFSEETDLALVEATHPDSSWVKSNSSRYHLTEEEALEFTHKCRHRILLHKLHPSAKRGLKK